MFDRLRLVCLLFVCSSTLAQGGPWFAENAPAVECPLPTGGDTDRDGTPDDADCAAGYDQVWALTAEVEQLTVEHGGGPAGTTTLNWSRPLLSAGTSIAYDTIRSNAPDDFSVAASCVESSDGLDTSAVDTTATPPGSVFYYLVRAENFCGHGPAGWTSAGEARPARDCTPEFACLYLGQDRVGCLDPQCDGEDALDEASGLVQSRRQPEVLWSHNDDTDDERLFSLARDGRYLTTFNLAGVSVTDPEDIAIGPGPVTDVDYLYLGDVGGDGGIWGCESDGTGCANCTNKTAGCEQRDLVVVRFPEPDIAGTEPACDVIDLVVDDILTFGFPDLMLGLDQDVETLMLDPATLDLYFATKSLDDTWVFRAAYPYSDPELELVATLPFTHASGGDISADGSLIAIRTEDDVRIWQRAPGTNLWDALSGPYCMLPVSDEANGEAIALDVDSSGSFYTLSEKGTGQLSIPIHFFERDYSATPANW